MSRNSNVDARALNNLGATIKVIPPGDIIIYAVTESQLNELERGSQSDLFLEIAIACLSIFASFLASLLLNNSAGKVFITFVCITVITFIVGIVLLLLWYRQRKSKKTIINEIRSNESRIQE